MGGACSLDRARTNIPRQVISQFTQNNFAPTVPYYDLDLHGNVMLSDGPNMYFDNGNDVRPIVMTPYAVFIDMYDDGAYLDSWEAVQVSAGFS
ncbi:hypothetical protein Ciccas_007446 [Cichlidogyrus casuarinus]|uniref:Uncharacterized protein n=1 Tax=Cichlidogyrus casuarinus TaxID=1844966 RepID=A0ABD2Q2W6_9PLAT